MEAPGSNGGSDTGTRAWKPVRRLFSRMERLPRPSGDQPTFGSPPSLPSWVGHLVDWVFLEGAEVVAIIRGGREGRWATSPPKWLPTPIQRNGSIAVPAGHQLRLNGSLPGHARSPFFTRLVTSVRCHERSSKHDCFATTRSVEPHFRTGVEGRSRVRWTMRRTGVYGANAGMFPPLFLVQPEKRVAGPPAAAPPLSPRLRRRSDATSSSCSPTVRRAPTPRASATPDRRASATSGLRCECTSRRRRDGGA